MNDNAHALQSRARELASLLVARASAAGLTVSTAESLTAGLIAATIADVPGASAVLRGGIVSYAVDVKASVLGVNPGRLEQYGPVDPVVAEQMAAGAALACGSDLAVSSTGVAGPEPHGGQAVGTVYLGCAWKQGGPATDEPGAHEASTGVEHFLHHYEGDRDEVRWASVLGALESLLQHVPA